MTALERHPGFDVRRVPGDLPLVAITDGGLGNTSWALRLGDEVIIVDPERDPDPYLAAADQLGGRVAVVADTHLHADFLTGARELAAHGAEVVAPAAGQLAWRHHAVQHGDELDFGRWCLRVLATPGHTPEHVAYLLTDAGRPRAVFTGGSLLVGSVARTDLVDPAATEPLTRALWRSINRELLALPDDVAVLPTHGAGSFCAAAVDGSRWTTIGDERRANPLVQVGDENRFTRAVLDGLGSYPPYFLRLRELNRLGPRIVGALPLLDELTATRVMSLGEAGAVVVDVRSVTDYAAGHLPGSLANTLRPQFASWLGWLVEEPDTPLVFVTDDRTDRRELVRQCLNIGYENLVGEITIDRWQAGGGAIAATPLIDAAELSGRRVVDVRQAAEFAGGHVPGAVHVELGHLSDEGDAVGHGPVVVMCGHGERAATAASVLERTGHGDISVLVGGPGDWSAATGRPLER